MTDETKMILTADDAKAVMQAQPQAVEALLGKAIPNVIGVGAGVKWTNGMPTGEPALIVLVTHKVAAADLSSAAVIPREFLNMKTDVLSVGHLFATDDDPPMDDDDDPPMDDDDDPPMDDDDDPPMDDDDDPPMDDDDDPPMDDRAQRRQNSRRTMCRVAS